MDNSVIESVERPVGDKFQGIRDAAEQQRLIDSGFDPELPAVEDTPIIAEVERPVDLVASLSVKPELSIEGNIRSSFDREAMPSRDQILADMAEGEQPDMEPELAPEAEEDSGLLNSVAEAAFGNRMGKLGIVADVTAQSVAGVADAVSEMSDSLDSVTQWAQDKLPISDMELSGDDQARVDDFLDKIGSPHLLPDDPAEALVELIGEPRTGWGQAAHSMSQFLAPYLTMTKGLSAAGWAGKGLLSGGAKMLSAEAIVGATAFDPFDDAFAEMLEGAGVENDFLQWMTNNDTEAQARVSNALEAALLASAGEATVAVGAKGVQVAAAATSMLLKSAVGQKLLGTMGALWMARRELRKDSPQVEAALQIEREEAQKQLLVDLRGDPEGPAFNHGAQSIDEVVINFAHIKTDDDVKRVIQELADSDIDAIDKARRGVVGWDQTQLEAEKIDAWNMLTERAEGQPLNAAQTVAARTLWTKSGAAARGLAERLHRDPSPINKLAYKNALAVHAAIQRSVLGARAETARALNAWAIPVEAKNLEDVLELVGEEKNLEKIAKQHLKLTEAGMMAQADTLIYGSSFAKGKDMVNDLIYFSYLSGPKTHMRNIIGNAVVAPVHMLEREIAAGIGKLRGAAPGDRVESGEGAAYLYGMIKGTVRALRVSKKAEETGTVWRAWEEGESGFGVGKVEQPRIGGFDPEKHNIAPSTPDGSPLKSPGDLGSMNPYYMLMHGLDGIVRTPGKALAAGDELFKTQNYDAEINALAWREARAAMDRGDIAEDQVYDHAHKLVESPESYMELGAAVRAQRQTFTDVPEDTNFRHLWKAIARKTPWPLNKFILPFDRTAYNIGLYGFERTPLAPITQRFRTAIEKGGVDRDTALAQLAVGNSLLLIGLDLAMSGRITGHGPANMSQREGWMQEHAPMSFEFEQEDGSINSYSVRGIEPIGTFLGIAAGINDIVEGQDWENPDKEADKLLLAASMAIASQVTSQQYMSGVSSFFEMMSDPHRYADGYFKRIAGIASPTILSDITRVDDPVFRHVSSMIDAIKARAPGYSKELPGKFDRWGNQISRRSHMGPVYDAVSPFAARKMKPQPVDRELARLRKSVSKPSPYQTFYRDRVEDYKYGEAISINLKQLYPHAYWRMVEIAGKEVTETSDGDSITVMQGMFESSGKPLVEELNMIVDGSHPHVDEEVYRRVLTDGPEGGKQAFLTAIINAYRKEAKYKVLDEYPEVKAEVESRMKPEKYNWEAF